MDQIEGAWSPEEDESLLNLIEKHGPRNWSPICKSIPDRSSKSCWSRCFSLQRSFTPKEDEMLLHLFEKHGPNWSLISNSIRGRSGQSCTSRWLSLVEKEMDEIKRLWSPEEDEMLENLVKEHGRNWSLISKSIPGSSGKSSMLRWLSLYRPFTPGEDEMLQNLVKKHGPNWSLISMSLPGRSGQSCLSRWLFVHRPFTPEEDETILRAHARFGDKWSAIGRLLTGRTDDVIKNRWNLILKWKSSSMTNEDITIVCICIPLFRCSSAPGRGQGSSYIHGGNLSHEVGGFSRQPPSMDEMGRDNMSSGSTHSYSGDESAPSWNALNIRDSSPTMTESDRLLDFSREMIIESDNLL